MQTWTWMNEWDQECLQDQNSNNVTLVSSLWPTGRYSESECDIWFITIVLRQRMIAYELWSPSIDIGNHGDDDDYEGVGNQIRMCSQDDTTSAIRTGLVRLNDFLVAVEYMSGSRKSGASTRGWRVRLTTGSLKLFWWIMWSRFGLL